MRKNSPFSTNFLQWLGRHRSSPIGTPRTQIFFEIFRRMRSHEDLLWRSSQDLILRKIFAEFLRKIFWRFLEEKIIYEDLIKTFSSKNLLKIYINFLWKIFKQFLPKIFWRFLKDLQLKSFGDLWKILSSNLLEIFWRSSPEIFLRSSGLFFNF